MKYTEKYYRQLKAYGDKWGNIVDIVKVPRNVNEYNIKKIIDYMIETGYSFIVSAYIINNRLYKEDTLKVVEIKDIKCNSLFYKPRNSKVHIKIKNILENNILKTIVVGDKYQILDGYATLIALEQLHETHCICTVKTNYKIHKANRMSMMRQELYIEQNGRCYICGRKTKLDPKFEKDDLFATIDHMIPVSKGGSTSFDNCRLCCKFNNLKADSRYSNELKRTILHQIERRRINNREVHIC